MDEKNFFGMLREYLDEEKVFVRNPKRYAEFSRAFDIAGRLFPDCDVRAEEDPLQMGAMILTIEGDFFTLDNKKEMAEFAYILSLADNFDIYSHYPNRTTEFDAVFQGVLTRVRND